MRRLVAGTLVLFSVVAARADTMFGFTDRASFNGNDFVDWGGLGPASTSVSNPFTISSNGGLSLNVNQAAGSFLTMEQSVTWSGNFAPLDALLWTNVGPNGPITMNFGSPISGGGVQIQNFFFGAFTGTVDAYNGGGTLLGSFTVPGNSNNNSDNSAIFIGIQDLSGANITRLVFGTSNSNQNQDFAINRMVLLTQPAAVPEPGTFRLLLTAVVGLVIRRIHRPRREINTASSKRE
jgi:hypothetical protein